MIRATIFLATGLFIATIAAGIHQVVQYGDLYWRINRYIETEGKVVYICPLSRRYVLQTPDNRLWLHTGNRTSRHTEISHKEECS